MSVGVRTAVTYSFPDPTSRGLDAFHLGQGLAICFSRKLPMQFLWKPWTNFCCQLFLLLDCVLNFTYFENLKKNCSKDKHISEKRDFSSNYCLVGQCPVHERGKWAITEWQLCAGYILCWVSYLSPLMLFRAECLISTRRPREAKYCPTWNRWIPHLVLIPLHQEFLTWKSKCAVLLGPPTFQIYAIFTSRTTVFAKASSTQIAIFWAKNFLKKIFTKGLRNFDYALKGISEIMWPPRSREDTLYQLSSFPLPPSLLTHWKH